MRVISGKAKGRKLHSVPGPGTRPITDRAKSAVFSILGDDVIDAPFLDLVASTGQWAIEALSRGAAEAVFVEKGGAALSTIQSNLELTGLTTQAVVKRADVFSYLAGSPQSFDYIYVAPPQYRGWWHQTLHLIDAQPDWLTEDGWVLVQIHPKEFESRPLHHLELFDQRSYGSVMLCFYQPILE